MENVAYVLFLYAEQFFITIIYKGTYGNFKQIIWNETT